MASGLQEVGQAIIKLVYDDKDLEQQGDKVGLTMGAKLKTAGIAAAAGIGAAVVATTKKIGDLANKSAEAYGEFEQLAGGMEKIFDEVDQTIILQDAQNAWQDLNLSAREYMTNITGVGATFAQTMGDKKGYETARTGMKAIADFASATGRNVDDLMGKYQLISRTAGSYLSIADQFAGILPQTRDDFLKQAQAAGFLIEKYKSLTEVPVAEYQEDITKMIEKGVGDMGLLGNTADETAKTLTGSLAGAKSAIDNLITGFSDPSADISKLAETALQAVGAYADNFATILERALDGILKFIGENAGGFINKAMEFITRMAPKLIQAGIKAIGSIAQYLPQLIQMGIDLLSDTIDAVAEVIPQVMGQITAGIVGAIKVLTQPENLLKIIKAGITLLMALVEAIPEIIEALSESLPDIIENIVEWLTSPQALAEIANATFVLFGAMIAAIPRIIKALGTALSKLLTDAWDFIRKGFEAFSAKFGKAIGNAMAKGINGVLGFIERAINGPINAVNALIGALNAIPGVNIGKLSNINLPRVALAEGGVATSATTALIGEKGREAVIPLEQNTGNWAGLLAGKLAEEFESQGNAPGSTINVYFNNQIDSKLDIEEINQELLTAIRRAA